jgi:hypothetical protein
MKKYFIIGVAGLFFSSFLYIVGCSSVATPVTTTLPKVTFTVTPTPPSFPVLYSDGSLASMVTAVNSFSGDLPAPGAPGFPTTNVIDTTVGGYGGDSFGFLSQWTSAEVSVMGGYSGYSLAGAVTTFTGYTTCTFWAKANQIVSVGFNAAEPPGDTANVSESLTTTWTQYTINIAPGSRSDAQGGAINAVTTYFVCVITGAPLSYPLNVSVDRISFQGLVFTPTFTNTPTNTITNTPGGATATFTNTPTNTLTSTITNTPGGAATSTFTNTPTNTATPYAIYNGLTNGGSGPFVGGNGANEFDSGGGAYTGNNPINLTDTTFPYNGETYDANWTMENSAASYYGWNLTSNSTNYTGCVNCTFYARTDRVYAGNGIEFFAGGSSNTLFKVTQTYAQYAITLPASLTAVTVPFGWVINPGAGDVTDLATAGNLNLYVDNIYYNL